MTPADRHQLPAVDPLLPDDNLSTVERPVPLLRPCDLSHLEQPRVLRARAEIRLQEAHRSYFRTDTMSQFENLKRAHELELRAESGENRSNGHK